MRPNALTFVLNYVVWKNKYAFGAKLANVVAGCCVFIADAFIEDNLVAVTEEEQKSRRCRVSRDAL